MYAAEVEVALWRHICYICGYSEFLAVFPYSRRCFGIVDCCKHHSDVLFRLEVDGKENAVQVLDLALLNTIGNLIIQTLTRTHHSHISVCIEEVDDAACCNLVKQPLVAVCEAFEGY